MKRLAHDMIGSDARTELSLRALAAATFTVFALVPYATPANATSLINDHFEGTTLAPNWQVHTEPPGWNWMVEDSKLAATENLIGGELIFRHTFGTAVNGEFQVSAGLTWDSTDVEDTMLVRVVLNSAIGSVLSAGIYDVWGGSALTGGATGTGGFNALFWDSDSALPCPPCAAYHEPLVPGAATLSIVRGADNVVTMSWNSGTYNATELMIPITADIVSLDLLFSGSWGNEGAFDYLTFNEGVIPEPSTGILLLAGLTLCASLRKTRRTH